MFLLLKRYNRPSDFKKLLKLVKIYNLSEGDSSDGSYSPWLVPLWKARKNYVKYLSYLVVCIWVELFQIMEFELIYISETNSGF